MSDPEKAGYFSPDTFSKLASAEGHNWWFRSRNKLILWALRHHVGSFHSFLEIGCGTGYVLEGVRKAYPDAALFGSEYFEEGLAFARKRVPSATFSRIDAAAMIESEYFDVIGAFDVLEHIEPDEKVLENLAKALRLGGAFLITVPQHPWLWSSVDEHACHVRRYVRPELVNKVERVGLRVDYVSSFVSLLLPLMWIARLRARTGTYDPMSEFRIPHLLNGTLESVMRLGRLEKPRPAHSW